MFQSFDMHQPRGSGQLATCRNWRSSCRSSKGTMRERGQKNNTRTETEWNRKEITTSRKYNTSELEELYRGKQERDSRHGGEKEKDAKKQLLQSGESPDFCSAGRCLSHAGDGPFAPLCIASSPDFPSLLHLSCFSCRDLTCSAILAGEPVS